ncbi:uncharacterized protein TRUGW13939_11910 [Talaromyces rugulosus]|uniref:DUF7907 domain-containing protein n=1 Tax=Talaromyces rugulosus TaxID=121627 RepID=A0A7H8REB4_TALRU|nr:uncharacterized protein TRUGW13939_11910 [Talaromyces rugulosus]QKX64734.1 hypothetical protein TRUGW13939_11910 [Talaromyces rugulosus]
MRFTLASAASVLAFAASASAATQKSYLQASPDEYLSASIAIDGFTHYALLTDAKSATPAIVTATGGEVQVDLSALSGQGVTGLLTLEDKEGFSGLKHAIFGNPAVVTATSGFDLAGPADDETLTLQRTTFHGWYACSAGVGVKQLYWSDWANYNGSAPTTCEKVTLTRVWL